MSWRERSDLAEAERERTLRDLRDAYARGVLDHEEFTACLDSVFRARSLAELEEVVGVLSGHAECLGDAGAADAAAVRCHLSRGENLVWVGRPDSSKHLGREDRILIPFSLLWSGFAAVWETTAVAEGRGELFVLVGAIFVAIGLYLTVGRFFFKAYWRRRTIYAVTNRRVICLVGDRGRESIETTQLQAIHHVRVIAGRDGLGTVAMGAPPIVSEARQGTQLRLSDDERPGPRGFTFYDIRDAGKVADLVQQLR